MVWISRSRHNSIRYIYKFFIAQQQSRGLLKSWFLLVCVREFHRCADVRMQNFSLCHEWHWIKIMNKYDCFPNCFGTPQPFAINESAVPKCLVAYMQCAADQSETSKKQKKKTKQHKMLSARLPLILEIRPERLKNNKRAKMMRIKTGWLAFGHVRYCHYSSDWRLKNSPKRSWIVSHTHTHTRIACSDSGREKQNKNDWLNVCCRYGDIHFFAVVWNHFIVRATSVGILHMNGVC